tara:strand:- start:182 stop:1204 length:1023 start_codon:yes stop_codon:yes gene_type:complete
MRISFISLILFTFFSCINNDQDHKRLKSEITILSEKVNDNPNDIIPLLNRAKYNLDKNKYESALFDLKQCIKLDSLDSECNYLAAVCYYEILKKDRTKSDYGKYALECIEKSIDSDEKNYMSLALFGELNTVYGKYQKAIEMFNKSLSIEYNQEKTHNAMGYAFKKLGQFDNAINCFQNSININPDFLQPYIQLGLIYELSNDTLTEIFYKNALKLDSSNIIALTNLANYYRKNMLYNKALTTYNKILDFDSFDANTHYNIGFIHMELDLHEIAVNNFADAIYSNSAFYEAYYARGICFETLGNIAQAEVDYRRSVEINPDYLYAKDALKNLNNNNIKYK